MTNLDLERISALEAGILGETRGGIALETSLENKAASLSLMDQASRSIDILSYDLEPKIYNNREMYTRFRQFATRNRFSHIRILIHDAKPVVHNGHILIELIERLTSSIEIRRLCSQDRNISQGFMVADKTAYLLRQEATRFEAHIDFSDRAMAKELSETFDSAWHRADFEPELRRLHL